MNILQYSIPKSKHIIDYVSPESQALKNIVVLKLVGVTESGSVAPLQNGQGVLAKVSVTDRVEILLEKEKAPVDRQTI